MVAVYSVLDASVFVGLKIAVMPATVTVPGSAVVPCIKVNVVVVTVNGFIGSLKVAEILPSIATPVAAVVGNVEMTVGGVLSAAAPVVKVHLKLLARFTPAKFSAPVVIVAVYRVLGNSAAAGLNIPVTPA